MTPILHICHWQFAAVAVSWAMQEKRKKPFYKDVKGTLWNETGTFCTLLFSTLCFNNIQSCITEIDCIMSPSCSFYRKIVRSLWLRSLRSCFREFKLGEVSQKWRCHYWCLVWTKISLVTIDNQSSDPQASKLPFQHNLAPIHSTNHTIRPGRWIYQEWVRTSGIEMCTSDSSQ